MRQAASEHLRGGGGRRVGRNHGVGDGQRGGHGKAIQQQGAAGFARQAPDQRHQHDEAYLEEDRQAHQKGGDQHGPRGALFSEAVQQPIGQRACAAGVLQEAPDHGAQPDYHGDETQRVPEAALNGLENLVGRHAGGEAHGHAGEQQRQERVQLDGQNEE